MISATTEEENLLLTIWRSAKKHKQEGERLIVGGVIGETGHEILEYFYYVEGGTAEFKSRLRNPEWDLPAIQTILTWAIHNKAEATFSWTYDNFGITLATEGGSVRMEFDTIAEAGEWADMSLKGSRNFGEWDLRAVDCPFCEERGRARVIPQQMSDHGIVIPIFSVRCEECHNETIPCRDVEDAIGRWMRKESTS